MNSEKSLHGVANRHVSIAASAAAVAVAMPLLLSASPASAETRGYVVSWFATATNNPDFVQNCPQAAKDPNRVKFVAAELNQRRKDTAIVDGKAVLPIDYPDAVQKEPDFEPVVGKYAYGFDLGGPDVNKFVDPDTREKIDNQLWRALGCDFIFQATPPRSPYFQEEGWMNYLDSSPAWVMQVSGADLSKDGPVKITLDRSLRHAERDAQGAVGSGTTYVLDPSPRSHNVLSGEIKDGVLTVKSGYIYIEGDMTWYAAIDLQDAHMRVHSELGKIVGYWGGYTDWHRWVYQCTSRPSGNCDGVKFYRALEKYADADPDPVTGKNRMISTTWRMEAVPAYLAAEDGQIVANASSVGLGGVVHASTVAADPTER